MEDHELDGILRDLGRTRHRPPDRLVRRTRGAMRGRGLIHLVAFLSLGMQLLGVVLGVFALASPDVDPLAKVFTVAGLTALFGAVAVIVVVARSRVSWFFKRIELVTA